MVVARRLGQLLVACALLIVGWDVRQSYEPNDSSTTSNIISDNTLKAPPPLNGELPAAIDWNSIAGWINLPVALLLGIVGLALWMAGRRRATSRVDGKDAEQPIDSPARASPQARDRTELQDALQSCRSAFLGVAAFSFIINILMLTGAVFMLEIYDRVLPSRSIPTLIGLCIIATILFMALAILDLIRSRLLTRAGDALDETLATRMFDLVVSLPVRSGRTINGLQPLRDLESIRSFLSGSGPTAFFDLPWLPFYLGIVYAFHPWLGWTALAGAIVLIGLTMLTEVLARNPVRNATAHGIDRNRLAEACLRNAEVLAGMGFSGNLKRLWHVSGNEAQSSQRATSDIISGLGAIARVLRMVLQSAVLAVGAYLVILQEASGGVMIAGSILAARALAPVDIALANWRGFIAARESWRRLGMLLVKFPASQVPLPLPAPSTKFQVENVVIAPPGGQKIVVRDISFTLNAGQGLGVIGASGSGKSSLARVLVGAWLPIAGKIGLDGAAFDQWQPEALGRHLGYLPQDVELFAGSIAQNIARFAPNADPNAIIKAAQTADVHQLIVNKLGGYDANVGDHGTTLSAGQRQRVALARALYGDPFLVVLDEPDAALDQEGEVALQKAIQGVRERGGIAIVISHRQSMIGAVDMLLALQNGQAVAFGPKEMVLQKLARPATNAPNTVHVLKSLPEPNKS